MKYKVGDLVRIIKEEHGHKFEIGQEVFIEEVNQDTHGYLAIDGSDYWWIRDDEIELIPDNNELKENLKLGLKEALVSRGKRKGLLKANCPPMNTMGSAVWNALQSYSNPHKVGMGHMMFMNKEVKEVYFYLRKIGEYVNLTTFDRDGNVLRELGIF